MSEQYIKSISYKIKVIMFMGGILVKNAYELFALIGKNMKIIRKDIVGKSQEKMAEETDLSRSFISHIESPNVDSGISLDTLFYLAQKYNFDIRKFFDGYEELMNNNDKNV